MSSKTIIFIRHGESTENVKTADVLAGVKRLKEFKLPRYKMFTSGFKLLEFQLNAPLSDLGIRQVRDMALILKSKNFWREFNPDLVLYSPLQRAKHTLLGIYPPRTDSDTTSEKYDPFVASLYRPDKLQEMECLREATPLEHVPFFTKGLRKRMKEFEDFLQATPHEKIVVCGHSQYFKQLLKLPNLMRNVDVWQATYRLDDVADSWSFHDVHLVHRTELSKAHVFDKIVGVESDAASDASTSDADDDHENEGAGDDDNANVINDSRTDGEDSVKICRICTCSNKDLPEKAHTLIQPCACRGSQAFVHTACLNRWRATSDAARDICSVCKFRYRVRRNQLANFLMSPGGILVITIVLLLLLIIVTGAIFYEVTKYLREHADDPFIASWYSPQWLLENEMVTFLYDPAAAFTIQTLRFPKSYLWWRQCRASTYGNYVDNLNFLWALDQQTHDTRGVFELTLMDYMAHSMSLLAGMLQNSALGCNSTVYWWMEVIITGVGLIATYGLSEYLGTVLFKEVNWNNIEDSVHKLFPLVLILLSTYSSPIFGRFVGLVGLMWSVREVYRHMILYGSQLATNLGETILERDAAA